MLVTFIFKDQNGKMSNENQIQKELTNDEIMVMLNAKEISYPVNTGILYTSKKCEIINTTYDMFSEQHKLLVELQEKKIDKN